MAFTNYLRNVPWSLTIPPQPRMSSISVSKLLKATSCLRDEIGSNGVTVHRFAKLGTAGDSSACRYTAFIPMRSRSEYPAVKLLTLYSRQKISMSQASDSPSILNAALHPLFSILLLMKMKGFQAVILAGGPPPRFGFKEGRLWTIRQDNGLQNPPRIVTLSELDRESREYAHEGVFH